jgi:hypothetical protein
MIVIDCTSPSGFDLLDEMLAPVSFINEYNYWSWEVPENPAQRVIFETSVDQLDKLVDLFLSSTWLSNADVAGSRCQKGLDELLYFGHHSGTKHVNYLLSLQLIGQLRLRATIL